MTVDHKAARARAEAATPGPWRAVDYTKQDACHDHVVARGYAIEIQPAVDGRLAEEWDDATFIAAARTDVPAMADEIDRLRGEADRVANSFMDGEHDCNICERVTANGTCTECRHGTSPLLKARADVDRLRAAITQALSLLSEGDAPDMAIVTLREAIGIEVGP